MLKERTDEEIAMKYIKQLAIILMVTAIEEVLKYLLPLPVPASIYGLVLMLILLMTKVLKLEQVKETGEFLIEIMLLMFIIAILKIIDLQVERLAATIELQVVRDT